MKTIVIAALAALGIFPALETSSAFLEKEKQEFYAWTQTDAEWESPSVEVVVKYEPPPEKVQQARFASHEPVYVDSILQVSLETPRLCNSKSCASKVEIQEGQIESVCDPDGLRSGVCGTEVIAISGHSERQGTFRIMDDEYYFEWDNPNEVKAGTFSLVSRTSQT